MCLGVEHKRTVVNEHEARGAVIFCGCILDIRAGHLWFAVLQCGSKIYLQVNHGYKNKLFLGQSYSYLPKPSRNQIHFLEHAKSVLL